MKEGLKREMSALERERLDNRKRLVGSGFLFGVGYLFIVLLVFIVLIVNPEVESWVQFIKAHTAEEFIFLISIFVLLLTVYLYFFFEERSFLYRMSNTILFFSIFILSAALCYVWGLLVNNYIYTRPYAIFAIVCFFLLGRRHAFFLNAVFVFFMFSIDLFAGEYSEMVDFTTYATLLIGFANGTLAIFLSNRVATRLGLLFCGLVLTFLTVPVSLVFQLPIAAYGWRDYIVSSGFQILGCLTAVILALAVIPIFEGMFNRLTSFRLRELTSANAPLLARLKREAPGTFNHSLIVAQLCEACAVAIGENAELARAAAYYHDVGKLKEPACFTENQADYNVHDELTPELSADIIRSHATEGYQLLVTAHLPKEIADIAREHHGTLPIKFFYDKAMRISGGDANILDFSYRGPKPQSRIAAIVMIADGAEAATRSSKDHTPANVERIVRSIIEERMDLGQFEECDITLRDLTVIKQTLVDALSGVHHHRVEYPAIRFGRDNKTSGGEHNG